MWKCQTNDRQYLQKAANFLVLTFFSKFLKKHKIRKAKIIYILILKTFQIFGALG